MTASDFASFIHTAAPFPGGIGLTHVTDCVNIAGVINSGKLEARWCGVFQKKILYLFYGRPAYRPMWSGSSTSDLSYARICFILRDCSADSASRVLPFDSGGYGIYKNALHKSLSIEDFDVDPTDPPRKVVSAFYESYSDYFWMRPLKGLTFTLTQPALRSYYKLITGGLAEEFDDRCAAIEVQLEEPLPLKDQVLAVIGPNQIFDDQKLMDQINLWGAEARGYKLTSMFNPSEIGGRLFDEVERYLIDEGHLP